MLGCESILAVTVTWYISSVCVDFFYVLSEAESLLFGGF